MGVSVTQQAIVKTSGETVNKNLFKSPATKYDPTLYLAYQFELTENLTANTTYTMQLWDVDVSHTGKTVDNLGISVYWGGGSTSLFNIFGSTYFTNGHADHIIKTFTVTSSQASGSGSGNLWLNLYNSTPSASGTMNMSIDKWKIEKGSIATPWNPASTDSIYVGDNCGFTELDGNHCSFGESCIVATEFIEI